ncbi:MAG: hypothetical protein SOZ71_04580 [Clostridium sp.]|nr:hypothetical protein [Clostridium sp.]
MIAEADKFPNNMCNFIFALAEKRDLRLQKYMHEISDSRSKENSFPIDIIF